MATLIVNPPPVRVQDTATTASGSVLVLPVTGPQGPQGEPGAAGSGYTHTQSSASASWVITHNLGFRPNVAVQIDGEQVIADVTHSSVNAVTVTFASPQSGFARLA